MTEKTDELKENIVPNVKQLLKFDIEKVNPRAVGELLSLVLYEDKLKYAFARACKKNRTSPGKMAKKAIKFYLEEKGYL